MKERLARSVMDPLRRGIHLNLHTRSRVLWVALLAFAAADLLAGDGETVLANSVVLSVDVGDRPVPKVNNGYVISRHPDLGNVWLIDRGGDRAVSVQVTIPEASVVRVNDAAAGPSGQVAVLATATTPDGKLAPFIAWYSASGQLERVVRTTPFAAAHILFSPSGTLWAVGNLYNEEYTTDVPRHDVLWEFDSNGVKKRSVLSSDLLGPRWRSGASWLAMNGNKIGVFCERAKLWFDIDAPSATVLGRHVVALPADAQVGAIALTASGDRLLEIGDPNVEGSAAYSLFRLDPVSGKLVRLEISVPKGTYVSLIGADQDLIFLRDTRNASGRSFFVTRVQPER